MALGHRCLHAAREVASCGSTHPSATSAADVLAAHCHITKASCKSNPPSKRRLILLTQEVSQLPLCSSSSRVPPRRLEAWPLSWQLCPRRVCGWRPCCPCCSARQLHRHHPMLAVPGCWKKWLPQCPWVSSGWQLAALGTSLQHLHSMLLSSMSLLSPHGLLALAGRGAARLAQVPANSLLGSILAVHTQQWLHKGSSLDNYCSPLSPAGQ